MYLLSVYCRVHLSLLILSLLSQVRGVLLPVSPVSPVCQKQTSITSKSKSQQALGVPQIMRLASRDVTSCLDLAVIASTDQVKKKKATKKNISTSPVSCTWIL